MWFIVLEIPFFPDLIWHLFLHVISRELSRSLFLAQTKINIHDFRSAMVWILAEAGFGFSPQHPRSMYVWIKMHRNGTVYCPYEEPKHDGGGWERGERQREEDGGGRGPVTAHFPEHTEDFENQIPSNRRPMRGSLTANLRPDVGGDVLFNEFRTTKLLQKPSDKPRTGLQGTLGHRGQGVSGGISVHKAMALVLANKKMPLMQALIKPVESVAEARERNRLGGFTQAELNLKRNSAQAAEAARLAVLERERENMLRMRLPSRDRNGRRILPAAHAEKEAHHVWNDDPLQVPCDSFFETGIAEER